MTRLISVILGRRQKLATDLGPVSRLNHRTWRGGKEADLHWLPKDHKSKLTLARRLRQETTANFKRIARRLHVGS